MAQADKMLAKGGVCQCGMWILVPYGFLRTNAAFIISFSESDTIGFIYA